MADGLYVSSRKEARAKGLKFYKPVYPCRFGHEVPRYASDATCTECARIYRAANKEKNRKYNKQWKAENPDRVAELHRKFRRENPESIKRANLKYASNLSGQQIQRRREAAKRRYWEDPEYRRSLFRAYIARKQNSDGTHTAKDIEEIYEAQRGHCACCRLKLGKKYHVDHIIALVNGGSNGRWNLQILCQPCNQSKSDRDPVEFMQSRGFLL